MKSFTYSIENKKIKFSAKPCFSSKKSFPEIDHYVWSTELKITNYMDIEITVMPASWIIVDMLGVQYPVTMLEDFGPIVLGPMESRVFLEDINLSSPAAMAHGWIDLERNGHKLKSRMPTLSLESPFYSPILH